MKKSSIALLLLALLGARQVFALGLGEPQVRSYLGQSLRVTAPLIVGDDAGQGVLDDGSVSVGDKALFRKLKLPYQAVHAQLKVELKHQQGVPFVELTTRRAFTEPMLEVPLDIQLGRSRLVRVVTLLLDPPPARETAVTEQHVPGQTPLSSAEEPALANKTMAAAVRRASPAAAQMPSPPRLENGRYGPVALNQTLGDIAREVGYREATLYQNLIALWEANPGAFLHDNMNHLKAGVTLRIPDRERVLAYSTVPAREEVLAQYRESKNPSATSRRLAGADASDEASPSPAALAGEANGAVPMPRLKISAAIAKGGIPPEFREEFNTVYVALEETEQENTELRSRIELLEQQVTAMSEMLLVDAAVRVEQLEQAAERLAMEEQAEALAAQGGETQMEASVNEERGRSANAMQEQSAAVTESVSAEPQSETQLPAIGEEPATGDAIVRERSEEPRMVLGSVAAAVPLVDSPEAKNRWWGVGFVAGLVLLMLVGIGGWLVQRRRQVQHYQQLFRDF